MSEDKNSTTVKSNAGKSRSSKDAMKKYQIVIHSRSENDPPFVDGGVNGKFYRIRRGVPVVVDETVLASLQTKEMRSKKEMNGNEEVMKYYEMPRNTVEVVKEVTA